MGRRALSETGQFPRRVYSSACQLVSLAPSPDRVACGVNVSIVRCIAGTVCHLQVEEAGFSGLHGRCMVDRHGCHAVEIGRWHYRG